ncbi:MAG: hypothetical protein EXS00_02950 [Phycisphaerales bacterium]|nr:hypothetical protein [Phycisphaerales bacterium]
MAAVVDKVLRLIPTNPIVLRLMWAGGRRRRDLSIRSIYLALMILVLVFSLVGGSGDSVRDIARQGANAFEVISYGQIALIVLVTPLFMAGAIAQESDPKTWEILLATPLSSIQIVLGGLFGRLSFVLALLLSTLPLFAVTQLFGGVPGRAILASYGIAALSALLVGVIAITLCVTRTAGKRAVMTFYSSVVLFVFATAAADSQLREPVAVGSAAVWTTAMTPLNPFLTLEALLSPSNYVTPDVVAESRGLIASAWFGDPVGTQAWLFSLASVGLILWATISVRRAAGRSASAPRQSSAIIRRAPDTVGTNPIAWRELHQRRLSIKGVIARWTFVGLGLALALLPIIIHRVASAPQQLFRVSLLAILCAEIVIITLVALNTAGTAVSHERENGNLDILLTTPIQPGQYLAGKLQGLVRYLLPLIFVPVFTLAVASVYVMTGAFGNEASIVVVESVGVTAVSVPMVLPMGALALPLSLLPFTAVCVMIGLNWSIRSKGTITSVVLSVLQVAMIASPLGLCLAGMGSGVPYVGAALNALVPINIVLAAVQPSAVLSGTLDDPAGAQWSLLIGAVAAAICYCAIVYAMHAQMKNSFMVTVRRLAGTN